jgi:hypothetical protein
MDVKISDPKVLNLPKKQRAVNNADIIRFNKEYFLAYRTCPFHFSSKKTELVIVKSKDTEKWDISNIIFINSDIREPRFVKTKNSLFLYFFKAGIKAHKFQPDSINYIEYKDEKWSKPVSLGLKGYVNWRIREYKGSYYMSIYDGRKMYGKHKPDLQILKSKDAKNWKKFLQIPVNIKGAAEPEFAFDENNTIYGTIRLEGYGSVLVSYDGSFKFKQLKTKFDSNLMFKHKNKIYMVARRNIDGISHKTNNRIYNLLRYSFTRKTTALYEFDRFLKIKHISDIKSQGDTAFPGICNITDNKFLLVNYSSILSNKHYPWIIAQLFSTELYKYIIEF